MEGKTELITNPEQIGSYRFTAEPFHVDFNGRLTLGVLGNQFLNCAGFHATERGIGIASINEENYTWVLSRLAIEMEEMPYQYDTFTIQTWVENVHRLFTARNYAVIDKDGRAIGYARSIWAMINLNTRKPADLLGMHGGVFLKYVCGAPCPIAKPSHIRMDKPEFAAELTAKYSDIDINGHINSVRYIEHILDLFPLELYKSKRVHRFEIAYTAEGYYNDCLQFYKEQARPDEYNIEITKNAGDVTCRAKVLFK